MFKYLDIFWTIILFKIAISFQIRKILLSIDGIKILVDITDPIIAEKIEEDAYEISQIYAQIRIDNLEYKTKNFNCDDYTYDSDSSSNSNESNEEFKCNESFFSKYIIDIKATITKKELKRSYLENHWCHSLRTQKRHKTLSYPRLHILNNHQLKMQYKDGSPTQVLTHSSFALILI